MALDSVVDFGLTTVSTTYDASQTSIVLTAGGGALLPAAPFDGVWWNSTDYSQPALDPNKEIVRVTAKSTDTLTVTRGQRGISATTKNTAGKTYSFQQSFTKKLYDDILAVTFVGDGTVLSSTPSSALSTGTLPATLVSQSANVGLFGPTSGGSAAPTFRALVNADLGTTLTPQFVRLGIGQAADATVQFTILSAALGTTPSVSCLLTNTTAAAAGAQQVSPASVWEGFGWKTTATAASQSVRFRAYVLPVQGAANPTAILTIESSINGGAYANPFKFYSDGSAVFGGVTLNTTYAMSTAGAIYAPTVSLGNSAYIASPVSGVTDVLNSGDVQPGAIRTGVYVVSKTANYTVLTTDTGTRFNNTGAVGSVNYTLPTAVKGLRYFFYVDAAQTLTITAPASTTIRYGATVTASAGNVASNTPGSVIELYAISTTQYVVQELNQTLVSVTGPWTFT